MALLQLAAIIITAICFAFASSFALASSFAFLAATSLQFESSLLLLRFDYYYYYYCYREPDGRPASQSPQTHGQKIISKLTSRPAKDVSNARPPVAISEVAIYFRGFLATAVASNQGPSQPEQLSTAGLHNGQPTS